MQIVTIKALLNSSFSGFATFINTLSDHRFIVSPEGKWSAGQQLDHLIRSAKPVNTALRLPKFILRFFGKPATASRTYDDIKVIYREVLRNGAVSTRPYIPPVTDASHRQQLLQSLEQQRQQMLELLDKWNEADLDRYQVPHPLLGKLTIREVLYFTAYHNYHHLQLLEEREMVSQPWAAQLERAIF